MTRKEALVIASNYGFAFEVAYEIDYHNRTPEEALVEWDIPIPSF